MPANQPTHFAGKPVVVLLHGGGLSAHMWQPVIERLPDFHCLAPDLPGHGAQRDGTPFDLEAAARQASDLITSHAPNGQAHLVGLSLGGAVALTIMRLSPERVGRSLVSGTAAGVGRWLGGLALSSLWMLRFIPPDTLARYSARQWGIPERYLPLFLDDIRAASGEAFNRDLIRSLMELRLPDSLPGPLLAVVGEKETIPARQAARALARRYPQAQARRVAGLGHVWALQDPDLFAATVRAWVLDQALPAALRPM